jgi:cytochrome c7-like protein
MRGRDSRYPALLILAASTLAWGFVRLARPTPGRSIAGALSTPSPVFTLGHSSLSEAIREFFDFRTTPQQPIAFTHKVHLAKGLECTSCHQGVEQGPNAGLPSVKLCMTCHLAVATDRPEIKKVAAYLRRGEEIPWQRVYGYYPSAHVRFNHAPHIRAGVACATCHGDMTKQTVATRTVDLDMGYCLSCHKQRKASVDCTTCHF